MVAGRLKVLKRWQFNSVWRLMITKTIRSESSMFDRQGRRCYRSHLFEETGDVTWASRFRRDVRLLWDKLEACEGVDCLIWQQELQGHKATHLGAVHGFAGNALPALRGRHLLPENEQKNGWIASRARCGQQLFATTGWSIGLNLLASIDRGAQQC